MAMKWLFTHRSPDFFVVLLILVTIGFGATLAVQVSVADRHHVVETELPQQQPNAG
jgi:hypothetical protein